MGNESDNYVPISKGDIFLDTNNYGIYKGPIISVEPELITVKPFNVPKEEQGKKDYFLIQYPRFAVTEDMIKRESKPGEIKGGVNYKCGDIVKSQNPQDTSEYFIIEKKEGVVINGVQNNCYALGCVNYEYERIEVKTKVIESEFTKVEDDTFFEKQLAHCFINKFGEDSITNIDSSNKSKGKNNKLDKKIGIINDLLRLFENVLNQDYEELRFFTEDDVEDYEVEYNGTFASLIEHTDWWFLTELEETNRYILDFRKLYRWNFFDKTPRDKNRFNIIFEILDKYYEDGDKWLSKNYISSNYKAQLKGLYELLKIRNETQTIKRSTGKSKKKTSESKKDNKNSEEKIFIGGVDLIIYHILNLNKNPCLLLNNISYKNKNVEIGDGLGYLFNMKFNVNEKQINEVTLNYNMLGFLMLLTELEHDFAEVKKITNSHLDTINQNFINISHALKEKIKKPVNFNNNNSFVAAATASAASEANCDNLWDNIYGVIDSYSENKKKKLSEEEMGRIITALLSNDDMPRLITANDKVNMQMYAPTPLKGTIPKFWSIMNTNTSDISDDIEESGDEDLKESYDGFVFVLNMQREQLGNLQKDDERVTAILSLISGLIEYSEKLKNIEDYKSGVLDIRGSLNKLKKSYFEEMEQQTGVAYESYRAIDSGVKGLETKLAKLENPGSDFKAMSTTKESIITPISYAEKTINLTSDADNKAAYVIPKTTNMRQIKSDNYPLLKLDAGSSPTFKRNDEYYSWFDSLNKDEDEDED